ncbi:MAG: ferredoxin [Candidatus Nanopelagicales bacterium]
MKAKIDAGRCDAKGYCAKFAPKVFELDEDGYGRSLFDGVLPDGLEADAQSAADACPTQAVILTE